MKKATIIIILTFFLTGNLLCQVKSIDIYEVLNSLIEINNVESLSKKAKSLKTDDPYLEQFVDWCLNVGEEKIDISELDSTYVKEQLEEHQEIKWEKKKVVKKIKIKRKSVDYFSIPLFLNKEKTLVIVYHSEYCGPLAAEGKFELYQKTDGKWKLINVMPIWVS